MTTLQLLIPFLTALATTAGAGVAASDLFALARQRWPQPAERPADRLAGLVFDLLYTRNGARVSVMALSGLISLSASAILAWSSGAPIGPALDQALAAIVASQLYHLKDMHGQVTTPAGAIGFEYHPGKDGPAE